MFKCKICGQECGSKGISSHLKRKHQLVSKEYYDKSYVSGDAKTFGNAFVTDSAKIYGDAEVCGDTWVSGTDEVYDNYEVKN